MTDAIEITTPATVVPYTPDTLRPEDIVRQVALIQEVMSAVMKDGEHYGKIPGCGDKPTLLQPGAQILALTFRMAPKFSIEERDLGSGHREYTTTATLVSINTGQVLGSGVGTCSTMESKYRYRNVADYEVTGEDIPKDAKEKKREYRKQGFGMKQVDGVWEWVKYGNAEKSENPDIADVYNTVLKMSTKRAFVHAVINATAASDMFTQDIEDYRHDDAAPAAPRASQSHIVAINALFDDLHWPEPKRAQKLKQLGASKLENLSAADAEKLIANLGEIRKANTAKPAEPEMTTAEVLAEQFPESQVDEHVPDMSDDEIPF